MKSNTIYKTLLLSCLFLLTACFTKTETEPVVTGKSTAMQHNYIAVAATDGSAAEVEISYSVLGNVNVVKTERKTTPFVFGGENVRVVYDSIALKHGKDTKYTFCEINRNYKQGGADYLIIKNLSSISLEYCVIGNQSVKYYPADRITSWGFSNSSEIDISKVLEQTPTPIYAMTPILYLINPDKSPEISAYVPWAEQTYSGGTFSIKETYAKGVTFKNPIFGDITLNIPFSIEAVMALYREEFHKGNVLFEDFSAYNAKGIVPNYGIKKHSMAFYGIIAPNETLENTGQIWFINTNLGQIGGNEFNKSERF